MFAQFFVSLLGSMLLGCHPKCCCGSFCGVWLDDAGDGLALCVQTWATCGTCVSLDAVPSDGSKPPFPSGPVQGAYLAVRFVSALLHAAKNVDTAVMNCNLDDDEDDSRRRLLEAPMEVRVIGGLVADGGRA